MCIELNSALWFPLTSWALGQITRKELSNKGPHPPSPFENMNVTIDLKF